MAFRESFNAKSLQAQFGSRLGERAIKRESPLKLTSVLTLTLFEKFSRRKGCGVMGPYEWLCDAVHPTFGSTPHTWQHKVSTSLAAVQS